MLILLFVIIIFVGVGMIFVINIVYVVNDDFSKI